jgi:hypothetical protein
MHQRNNGGQQREREREREDGVEIECAAEPLSRLECVPILISISILLSLFICDLFLLRNNNKKSHYIVFFPDTRKLVGMKYLPF